MLNRWLPAFTFERTFCIFENHEHIQRKVKWKLKTDKPFHMISTVANMTAGMTRNDQGMKSWGMTRYDKLWPRYDQGMKAGTTSNKAVSSLFSHLQRTPRVSSTLSLLALLIALVSTPVHCSASRLFSLNSKLKWCQFIFYFHFFQPFFQNSFYLKNLGSLPIRTEVIGLAVAATNMLIPSLPLCLHIGQYILSFNS